MGEITWKDFEKIEIRVGTVVSVECFPEARKPAYKIKIDFGTELGVRKSSAQITDIYDRYDLLGKQVVAVVNFPPKQIANFQSQCLVLGVVGSEPGVVLLQPERKVANGTRVL
ncbi:tRNA-binding protein [Robertkochia flava]|uniref:tRNA-binding protein n=1 Tax=Robertkochia flava TaxID=3447986 RepID=UPI001CCEF906|nr:tRNA-binding protein [Robertkochia marina]